MPAYNAASFISDAIQSVRGQSYGDWELIIVDDCSDDGTGAIIERYAAEDRRIRLIRRAEQGNAWVSRNIALKAAHGRFVTFMNAEDVMLPEKLARQLTFMQNNKASATYHAYRRISVQKTESRVLRGPARVTFETLLRRSPLALSTMMIDRHATGDITFDTSYMHYADLALYLFRHCLFCGRYHPCGASIVMAQACVSARP
jgi:teichuronic acid biosynthesis glycosyltransferase TuaG